MYVDPYKENFIFKAYGQDEQLTKKFTIFPYELARYAFNAERLELVQAFIDEVNASGKRPVLVFSHDTDLPISTFLSGRPFTFRYAMSKSHTYEDEHILPSGVSEFAEAITAHPAMPWSERPKVTFMGFSMLFKPTPEEEKARVVSERNIRGDVRGLISPDVFPTPANIGAVLRKQAVGIIESDSDIDSELLMRQQFFYHYSEDFQNSVRDDYYRSMRDTHYVLAFRGAGNYSIRLIETLAAGRLPIQLDTNQVLPFENFVDWKSLGIWVPLPGLAKLNEIIKIHHAKFNEASFNAEVQRVKEIFDEHLSRPGLLRHIKRILVENL